MKSESFKFKHQMEHIPAVKHRRIVVAVIWRLPMECGERRWPLSINFTFLFITELPNLSFSAATAVKAERGVA